MPRKKSTKRRKIGRPFAKGNKAAAGHESRKGVPQRDGTDIVVRKLDKIMVERYLAQNLHLTKDELTARMKDPRLPYIEFMICKVLTRIGNSGDVYAFNALLDRAIGPITQKITVDNSNPYASMSDEELLQEKIRLAALYRERLRQVEQEPIMYNRIQKVIDRMPPRESQIIDVDNADPIAGDAKAIASGE